MFFVTCLKALCDLVHHRIYNGILPICPPGSKSDKKTKLDFLVKSSILNITYVPWGRFQVWRPWKSSACRESFHMNSESWLGSSSFHNTLSAPSGIACCVLESSSSGVTGYHHEPCPYITHVQYGFAVSSDWTGFQATNTPTCFLDPTQPDNNCRSPHLWPSVSVFTHLCGTVGGDVSAGCSGSSYALCH